MDKPPEQEVYDLREEVKQLRENIAAITFTSVDTSQVTRFEVITSEGRALVKYEVSVELLYQDDGKTLKVFLKDKDKGIINYESYHWNIPNSFDM